MTAFESAAFRPLHFPDLAPAIGHLPFDVAALLLARGLVVETGARLTLAAGADLSGRLEDARALLARHGRIGPFRDEAMPVRACFDGPTLATIDRSALRIFGFWATKIHINGLVPSGDPARPEIWLSRRSRNAEASPGAFDTLVAGGQAANATIEETVAREAWEEAGIPPEGLEALIHRHELPITYVSAQGLHRELLVIADLALDADFVPSCRDGEIEESLRLPWPEMVALVETAGALKFGSRLVCKDLVRRLSGA